MPRWLDALRARAETLRASGQLVLWLALALGVSLTIAGLLEPLWPIRFLSAHLPALLTAPLEWLGLDPTTALIIYGTLLSLAALGIFAAAVVWARAHGVDERRRLRERMLVRLVAVLGFIGGFVGARAIVVVGGLTGSSGTGGGGGFSLPFREIWIQGYHIHHFFLGFLLLVTAGWIAIFHPGAHRRLVAALYGVGLGVFVDEWGLLVTWGNYHARSSWFMAVLFLALFLAGMLWTWDRSRDRLAEEWGLEERLGGEEGDVAGDHGDGQDAPGEGDGGGSSGEREG